MNEMTIVGIIIAILFGLISLGVFVYSIYLSVKTNKDNKVLKQDYKAMAKKQLIIAAVFASTLFITMLGVRRIINGDIIMLEMIAIIFGSLLSGFSLCLWVNFFILHYYGKDIDPKTDKWMFRAICALFPVFILSLALLTDGYAEYWVYPLVNGINFEVGLTHPGTHPTIAWYAICILSGAVFVYVLCDHLFYKEYGKHGILESTFLVAFPAGILGARIFYVIGQWDAEFAAHPEKIIQIWNGGLTILGGAFMGIVCGIAWFLWRNRKYNIWLAIDLIVPTILLAQAIGRWGNFFNCEVHGIEMSEQAWSWLPTFIFKNIHFGLGNGTPASEGNVFVPLFLIEGIANVFGYFVIAHLFGVKWRKYTQIGDLGFGYFIWYGLVRAILEPMRHSSFIMTDLWSWYWSLLFIFGGALGIVINHVVRLIIDNKVGITLVGHFNKKKALIVSLIVLAVALAIGGTGLIFMLNSDYQLVIGVSYFNTAILLFVIAGSIIVGLSIPLINYLVLRKQEEKELNA